MNILESLENLEVSEACFDDIINLVKDKLSEDDEEDSGVPRIDTNNSIDDFSKKQWEYKLSKKKQKGISPSFAEILDAVKKKKEENKNSDK